LVRAISVTSGALLIALSFGSATLVADTRPGLIAEIVTLLAGLAGVGLLLYGLVPKRPGKPAAGETSPPPRPRPAVRSLNDLLIGASGLLLAAVLLVGLAVSAGWQWSIMGAVLLLPMAIGSVYLLAAFVRAPRREWKIELPRFAGRR
jgi:hypothetical protein